MDFGFVVTSTNFTASLVVSAKYLTGIWIEIALHLYTELKKIYILVMIYIHPIQEHEMSPHLVRSSFISFTRTLKHWEIHMKFRNKAKKMHGTCFQYHLGNKGHKSKGSL